MTHCYTWLVGCMADDQSMKRSVRFEPFEVGGVSPASGFSKMKRAN